MYKQALALFALGLLSLPRIGQASLPDEVGGNIVFSPHGVEFLWSYREIVQGERIDGGCQYPVNKTAPIGLMLDGQRWISVQLESDPISCIQLMERGLYDETAVSAESNTIPFDIITKEQTLQYQLSQVTSPFNATTASAAQKEGSYNVLFTDDNNSLMQTLLTVAHTVNPDQRGIPTSGFDITGTHSQSNDCLDIFHDGMVEETLGFLGWTRKRATVAAINGACGQTSVNVSAQHHTESRVLLVGVDCSRGLTISYNISLNILIGSPNTLTGSVNVASGKADETGYVKCAGNLRKWEEGPY